MYSKCETHMTNDFFYKLYLCGEVKPPVYFDFGHMTEEEFWDGGQSRRYIINPDTGSWIYID